MFLNGATHSVVEAWVAEAEVAPPGPAWDIENTVPNLRPMQRRWKMGVAMYLFDL